MQLLDGGIDGPYNEPDPYLEIERLRSALDRITRDPPATLDEPDPDWEVIIKMRNIAREALGLPHGPTLSNGEL